QLCASLASGRSRSSRSAGEGVMSGRVRADRISATSGADIDPVLALALLGPAGFAGFFRFLAFGVGIGGRLAYAADFRRLLARCHVCYWRGVVCRSDIHGGPPSQDSSVPADNKGVSPI